MKTEKVYISRDESSPGWIYVWRQPLKGNWAPKQLEGCDIVNYQRDDIDNVDMYLRADFKKKFKMSVLKNTKKCVHLSSRLLNNEDYKLFSKDPKRKR